MDANIIVSSLSSIGGKTPMRGWSVHGFRLKLKGLKSVAKLLNKDTFVHSQNNQLFTE